MEPGTPVIALDHPWAFETARVGRKAATLAVARAAGLPVGTGVVLTVDWTSDQVGVAHQVWRIISQDGAQPLVVRRSPTGRGNRAARELGVVGVVRTLAGAPEFSAAVEALHDPATAVLVQPVAFAAWRGVTFANGSGEGRRLRPIVACVSQEAPDETWVAEIDQHGRTLDVISACVQHRPPPELLADLVRMSRRVDRAFEGRHDLDWVARADGTVRLIDIRPGLVATTPDPSPAAPTDLALTLVLSPQPPLTSLRT